MKYDVTHILTSKVRKRTSRNTKKNENKRHKYI